MNGKDPSPTDRAGGIDLDYRIGRVGSGASPGGVTLRLVPGHIVWRTKHAAAHPQRNNNEGDEAQAEGCADIRLCVPSRSHLCCQQYRSPQLAPDITERAIGAHTVRVAQPIVPPPKVEPRQEPGGLTRAVKSRVARASRSC